MTDFTFSSAYNANELAMNHARSQGHDTGGMQAVAGVLMTLMGIKMTMDAFNRVQERNGGARMGGRGR